MSKRLNDKVALITGAAELALFVKEGAKVIATDINAKLLNKHVDTLKEQYGDAILPLKLDVTKEDEWIDAVAQGIKKFKKIDILVNNAGIGITDNTSGLTDSTVNDWHLFMDTNAMSHFLGMKHVVPEMKKIGGGSIINISSLVSRGLPGPHLTRPLRGLPGHLRRERHVTQHPCQLRPARLDRYPADAGLYPQQATSRPADRRDSAWPPW